MIRLIVILLAISYMSCQKQDTYNACLQTHNVAIDSVGDTLYVNSGNGYTAMVNLVDWTGIDSLALALAYMQVDAFNEYAAPTFTVKVNKVVRSSIHPIELDLYRQSFDKDNYEVLNFIHQFDEPNTINVHIFTTGNLYDQFIDGQGGSINLGFTTVLRTPNAAFYEASSPDLDRVIVTDQGIRESMTLLHELCHYFNVHHPDQYSREDLAKLGIDSYKDVQRNHMHPNGYTDQLTQQQAKLLQYSALKYRPYLFNENQ